MKGLKQRLVTIMMTTMLLGSASAATCESTEIMRGLSVPVGMTVESSGDILVAEWSANRISRISENTGD